MKLKKIVSLIQNLHGVDLSAILVCESCEATRFYRQVMPDRESHETAMAQLPCTTCARLAGGCEACEE